MRKSCLESAKLVQEELLSGKENEHNLEVQGHSDTISPVLYANCSFSYVTITMICVMVKTCVYMSTF